MATPTVTITFSTATDVSAYVRDYTITRGRASILDAYQTGTATITLDNRDARFDRLHTGGPYYGNIQVGKTVTIAVGATTIFTGFVTDFNYGYTLGGDAVAYVECADVLARFANMWFTTDWTSTEQEADDRLTAILARGEVNYGGATSFDTGQGWEALASDSVTHGSNVLAYMQLVARSDWGRLFVNRSGTLVFRQRRNLIGSSPAVTFQDTAGATFQYIGIERLSGSEILRNYVTVDREGGTAQSVSDSTSITTHGGIFTHRESGLLLKKDSHAYVMADYLLSIMKDPADVIASITVQVDSLSSANRASVLALDLASVVRVIHTPTGGTQVDQTRVVESVHHNQNVHGLHTVTFGFAEINEVTGVFTLGSSALDGSDVLAF